MTANQSIPPSWTEAPLGELVEITKRPRGLKYSGEVAFVPMSLISESGDDITEFEQRLSPGSGTYFEEGDLLLARITPCFENGKQGIVRNVPNGWGVATTEVFPMRSAALSTRFLAYLFRSPSLRDELTQRMEGATGRMRVPLEAIRELVVRVPPRLEQDRILGVVEAAMSSLDHAKDELSQAELTAEAYLESALRQLFWNEQGQPRWPVRAIGDICETSSGGTPSRKEARYFGGNIPWIKIGDLTDGVVREVEEHITEAGLANSSARLLPRGTLLIAMYGASIGRLGVSSVEATTNQAICSLTPRTSRVERDYLYWLLRATRRQLVAAGYGGAQPNISQTLLRALEVPLADPLTQRTVVAEAQLVSDAVLAIRHGINQAQGRRNELSRAVLERAFAGRLHDPSPEESVSARGSAN